MKRPKTNADGAASKTIGFRLSGEYLSGLEALAAAENKSVGELAQEYVLAALEEEHARESLFEILNIMAHQIVELRKDVSLSTEALLSRAGKFNDAQARDWAENELMPREARLQTS